MGASLACYLNKKDIYKRCILYEEMMSNISEETNELFKVLDIPINFAEESIKALESHSQKKMFDKAVRDVEVVTENDLNEADKIFLELDIPVKIAMSVQEMSNLIH